MINVLFFVAVAIVLTLSVVAVYYLVSLYRHNQKQEVQKQALLTEFEETKKRHINSIVILSRAVLQDEVTLTEASIRISGLMSMIKVTPQTTERFIVFTQLAEATQHIPILEQWKGLSKKDQKAYEKERLSIEEKYRDFVLAACNDMIDNVNLLAESAPTAK